MVELFANNVNSGQTPRSAASNMGLHCLPVTLLGVSGLQWVILEFQFVYICVQAFITA